VAEETPKGETLMAKGAMKPAAYGKGAMPMKMQVETEGKEKMMPVKMPMKGKGKKGY
jgi:hypothetical protein